MEIETVIETFIQLVDTWMQMELRTQIVILLAFMLVMMAISAILDAYIKRCPSCRKWNARKLVDQKELSREVVYRDRPHTTKNYDAYGNEIGRAETTTRDPVTQINYINFYQCRKCKHKWEGPSISEH